MTATSTPIVSFGMAATRTSGAPRSRLTPTTQPWQGARQDPAHLRLAATAACDNIETARHFLVVAAHSMGELEVESEVVVVVVELEVEVEVRPRPHRDRITLPLQATVSQPIPNPVMDGAAPSVVLGSVRPSRALCLTARCQPRSEKRCASAAVAAMAALDS